MGAKAKARLNFEESSKLRLPSRLIHSIPELPAITAHRQISRAEEENTGVEAGHKAEEAAEAAARTAQRVCRANRLNSSRKAAGSVKKIKANRSHSWNKSDKDNQRTFSNPVSRWQQKQAIRKEYSAARSGKSTKTAKSTAVGLHKAGSKVSDVIEKTIAAVSRNPKGVLAALGLALVVAMMMNALSSCSQLALGSINAFLATSYTAEDNDICAADLEFTRLEAELKYETLKVESNYRGYDEYRYSIGAIGHEPYELSAYLTAMYGDFTFAEVKPELDSIFSEMYSLSYQPVTEVRYRTETRYYIYTTTDPKTGVTTFHIGSYTVSVPYNYYILSTNLNSNSLYSVLYPRMNTEQRDLYQVYMETRGNKASFGNPFSFNWHNRVSSLYGWRVHPISQNLQMHRGLDIAVPLGTPILSIHAGKVVRVSYDSGGFGNYVTIEDTDGYRSTYAHCVSVIVRVGQTVDRGELIAAAGSTGASTGSHLHIELTCEGEYLNPYFFIEDINP